MVNEYVCLTIDPREGIPRKSFWRSWNQLSRLQRSITYFFLICVLICLIYLMHTKSNEVPSSKRERGTTKSISEFKESFLVFTEGENDDEPVEKKVEKKVPENAVQEEEVIVGKKFSGPTNQRQEEVVAAFKHAWQGYKTYAWGHDMLRPLSKTYHDWFSLGLTLVDALDTMLIMNLQDYFSDAREWVDKSLNFTVKREVNVFEVTIRVLGGLLSAYHLTNDEMFLEKATDLGTRLIVSFATESGIPYSDIDLGTLAAHSPKWSPDSSTSEATTVQLEFRDLSRCTRNPSFESTALKATLHVHELPKNHGLVPIFINANTGEFRSFSTITLGARGDSYYEYLLKQWIQTGRTLDYLKDDYVTAINGIQKLLAKRTAKSKLLFIGELLSGGKEFKPKMDHLTCYLPGTLALGVFYGMPQHHMNLAEELLYTCYLTYAIQPTFLAPEISYFDIKNSSGNDIYVKPNDAHNLLRPEFVESLWVMYQITGNTTYQDWGWKIFQGFEKYTKVANGYTSIGSVKNPLNTRPKDMMESFFLGETLKYLYLLFSDNRKEINLKEFVLNTEAHPLPIYAS